MPFDLGRRQTKDKAMVGAGRRSVAVVDTPGVKRLVQEQKGYVKADALLARKWPEKYNAVGNLRWEG